jgi:hypothetical protein
LSRRTCLCRASAGTPPSSNDGINSSSGPNPDADRVPEELPDEITMEILSAQSWEDLYGLFYNSGTAAPSHQHCYGYLIALSELLPELDAPPPFAVAAAGINVGSSSSSGSSPQDLDKGWEALRAAGKVVSWNQLTALRVRAEPNTRIRVLTADTLFAVMTVAPGRNTCGAGQQGMPWNSARVADASMLS